MIKYKFEYRKIQPLFLLLLNIILLLSKNASKAFFREIRALHNKSSKPFFIQI